MISKRLFRISTAAIIVGSCIMTGPARAAVLYATGFESPTFTSAPFVGQDGWTVFGAPTASHVESTIAKTGSQAVEVEPFVAATQAGPVKTVSTSAPIVQQSADIYLASSTKQSGWQFAAWSSGLVAVAGGIDIDADGLFHAITSGFPVLGTFSRDAWNHVDLTLDYSAQTYAIALNGTVLGSFAFCGNNSGCNGPNVSAYSDGFFNTFPGSSAHDIGYLDNYSVAAVPLPPALPLLVSGLGVIGMLARRKIQNGSVAVIAAA